MLREVRHPFCHIPRWNTLNTQTAYLHNTAVCYTSRSSSTSSIFEHTPINYPTPVITPQTQRLDARNPHLDYTHRLNDTYSISLSHSIKETQQVVSAPLNQQDASDRRSPYASLPLT